MRTLHGEGVHQRRPVGDRVECFVSGVLWLVFCVWCLECSVWCSVCGVVFVVCSFWCLVFGVRCLVFCFFGVADLRAGVGGVRSDLVERRERGPVGVVRRDCEVMERFDLLV